MSNIAKTPQQEKLENLIAAFAYCKVCYALAPRHDKREQEDNLKEAKEDLDNFIETLFTEKNHAKI